MLKVEDILKQLEGVDPETPVVFYEGEVKERAYECNHVAYYTSANLCDGEDDVEPAVSCPYDGNMLIESLADSESGVIVFANYLPSYSRMPNQG